MPPDRRFTWLGASCHLVYGPASYESPRPLDRYYFGARPGLRTQSLPILPPPDPNRNDEDIETADPGVGEFASERGRVSSSREQTAYRTAFCVRLTGDNDEEDMERNTRDSFKLYVRTFGTLKWSANT